MPVVNPNVSESDFVAAMARAAAEQSSGNPFRVAPVGGNPFAVPPALGTNGAPMISLAASAPNSARYLPSLESFAPGGSSDPSGGNPFRVAPVGGNPFRVPAAPVVVPGVNGAPMVPLAGSVPSLESFAPGGSRALHPDYPAKHGFTHAADDYQLPGVPDSSPASSASSAAFDAMMSRFAPQPVPAAAPSSFDLAMSRAQANAPLSQLQQEAAGAPVPPTPTPLSAPASAPPADGSDDNDVMPSAVPSAVPEDPAARFPSTAYGSAPTIGQNLPLVTGGVGDDAGTAVAPLTLSPSARSASSSTDAPQVTLAAPQIVPPAPSYDVRGVSNGAAQAAGIGALAGLVLGGGRGALAAGTSAYGGYNAGAEHAYDDQLAGWNANRQATNEANANSLARYRAQLDGQKIADASNPELIAEHHPPKPAPALKSGGSSPMVEAKVADSRNGFLSDLSRTNPAGKQAFVKANLSSFKLWGLPTPATLPDGTLDLSDLGKITPAPSPDNAPRAAATAATDANTATLHSLYSELSGEHTTPQRVAQIVPMIQHLQAQMGGDVDLLHGQMFSALSPAQQKTLGLATANYALNLRRENFSEAQQQADFAQRATIAANNLKARTQGGGKNPYSADSTIYGQAASALSNLSGVNHKLSATDDPTERTNLEGSKAASVAVLRNIAKTRPDIVKKIGWTDGGLTAPAKSAPPRRTSSGRTVVVEP